MNHRPKVLAICQSLIPSAMIGVVKPLELLQKKGLICFSFIESERVTPKHLANSDILICVRGCAYFEVDIIRAARNKERLIVYFLDDHLLEVPCTASSHDYFSSSKIKDNIIKLLELSDILITPSINLGSRYNQYCSDVRITQVPALLLDDNKTALCPQKGAKEPVIIGFSGGIDHEWSLKHYLKSPIEQILNEFGDKVKFEVMGPKPNFLERLNINYIPYEMNHSNYVKKMQSLQWDIGLAPLPKTYFHTYKFYNKYLEYGAIGAAGIYSEVEPYTQIIRDGINGRLVDNSPESWVLALRELITNHSLRFSIANNSFNNIREYFCLDSVANQIIKAIPEFATYTSPATREQDFNINIIKHPFLKKFINLFKNHGYKAPLRVIQKILLKHRTGA